MSGFDTVGPDSTTVTWHSGSADNRCATTHPALPAPMIRTSLCNGWSTSNLRLQRPRVPLLHHSSPHAGTVSEVVQALEYQVRHDPQMFGLRLAVVVSAQPVRDTVDHGGDQHDVPKASEHYRSEQR